MATSYSSLAVAEVVLVVVVVVVGCCCRGNGRMVRVKDGGSNFPGLAKL